MSQGKRREPRSAKVIVTDVAKRDSFRPAMTRWFDRQLPRSISRLIFFPESESVARPKVRDHEARLEKKRWSFYRSIWNIIRKTCSTASGRRMVPAWPGRRSRDRCRRTVLRGRLAAVATVPAELTSQHRVPLPSNAICACCKAACLPPLPARPRPDSRPGRGRRPDGRRGRRGTRRTWRRPAQCGITRHRPAKPDRTR